MSELDGSSVEAVLCDFDDTLVNTFGPKSRQWQDFAGRRYGRELDADVLRGCYGSPFEVVLKTLCDVDPGDTDEVAKARVDMESSRSEFPKTLRDDTGLFTSRAMALGVRMGVVSSEQREPLMVDLRRFSGVLAPWYFVSARDKDPLIFTQEDMNGLPEKDGEALKAALLRLEDEANVDPSRVLHVGDSINDLSAARAAGIGFLAVTSGVHGEEDFILEGLPEERIFQGIGAVSDYLWGSVWSQCSSMCCKPVRF